MRPELQSRIAGIEAGEIDAGTELGLNAVAPFIDDPDFTVQFIPGPGWTIHTIFPNLWKETREDGTPNPWQDERVRIAANLAHQSRRDRRSLLLGSPPIEPMYGVPRRRRVPQRRGRPGGGLGLRPRIGRGRCWRRPATRTAFDETLYYTPDWGGDLPGGLALTTAQMLSAVGIRAQPVSIGIGEYFTDAYTRGGPTGTAPVGLYWFWANYQADPGVMWTCCTNFEGFLQHGDPRRPEPGRALRADQSRA